MQLKSRVINFALQTPHTDHVSVEALNINFTTAKFKYWWKIMPDIVITYGDVKKNYNNIYIVN